MRIDIYSKYKVRFLSSGAYISQEDSTPDDYVFSHYEEDKKIEKIDISNFPKRNNSLRKTALKVNEIIDIINGGK